MLSRFLRSQFKTPFTNLINSRFSTSSVSNLNFGEFTKIYRRMLPTEEFEYTIEDQANKVSFTLPEDSTLQDLKNAIQGQSQDIKTLNAYSVDLAELANVTKLTELGNETHYIVLNDKNLCRVASLDLSEADKLDQAYRKKEEKFLNIGLPFIEQQMLLTYFKRVDELNKQSLGKHLFADSDVVEGKVDKKIIIKNLLDGIIDNKNQQEGDEQRIVHAYKQQKARLEELKGIKEALETKAHSATKWKMSLGLFALLGQFSFVGIGTYMIFSWDVIEPMAYFLNLGGSILLSTLYFRLYNDYSNVGFLRHQKEKELKKLYAKHGFPVQEYEEIERTIELLEKKIKSNILVNL